MTAFREILGKNEKQNKTKQNKQTNKKTLHISKIPSILGYNKRRMLQTTK